MGKGSKREHRRRAEKLQNAVDAGGGYLKISRDMFNSESQPKTQEAVPAKGRNWYAKERAADQTPEPLQPAEEIYQLSPANPLEAPINEASPVPLESSPLEVPRYHRTYSEQELNSLTDAAVESAGFSYSSLETVLQKPADVHETPGDVPEDAKLTDEMIAEFNKTAGKDLAINEPLDSGSSSKNLTEKSNSPEYVNVSPFLGCYFNSMRIGKSARQAGYTPQASQVPRAHQNANNEGFFKWVWRTDKKGVVAFGLCAAAALFAGYSLYQLETAPKWDPAPIKRTVRPTRQERLVDSVESERNLVMPQGINADSSIAHENPVRIGGQEYNWISVNPNEIRAQDPNYAGKDIFRCGLKRKDSPNEEKPRVFVRNSGITGIKLNKSQKPVTRNIDGSSLVLYKTNKGITMIQDSESRQNADGTIVYSPKTFGDSYVLAK